MLTGGWQRAACAACFGALLLAWALTPPGDRQIQDSAQQDPVAEQKDNMETITLGAGCFWCTEAVFLQIRGVDKVVSGYSGGHKENPTYREVTTGTTGHAEVVQVTFDPAAVPVDKILEIFWSTHDPTTLNRQGADVGTQYRSVIFYHNDKQKERAEFFKQQLDDAKVFDNPIVTQIEPFEKFYRAEDYHQDYYAQNANQGYCQAVVKPKVDKVRKLFADLVKSP